MQDIASHDLYLKDLQEAEENLTNEEREERKNTPNPPPLLPLPKRNIRFMGKSNEEYLLKILKDIPSHELESSLIILPFNYVEVLFEFLKYYIEHNEEIELVTRCVYLLIKMHFV